METLTITAKARQKPCRLLFLLGALCIDTTKPLTFSFSLSWHFANMTCMISWWLQTAQAKSLRQFIGPSTKARRGQKASTALVRKQSPWWLYSSQVPSWGSHTSPYHRCMDWGHWHTTGEHTHRYIYIYLGSRNPLKIKCLERNLGSYRILKKTSGSVPNPRVCFLDPVLNLYLTHTKPIFYPY